MGDEVRILQAEASAPLSYRAGVGGRGGGGSFWQKRWVQEVLPWVTSSALHLTIIILVIAFYEAIQTWTPRRVEQEIIPVLEQREGPAGGSLNPGVDVDPTRIAAQDEALDSAERKMQVQGQRLNAALASGATGESESLMGIGPAGGFARGIGSGSGGDHTGGVFGVPGGGLGSNLPVKIVGVSGNAQKVVFVCDCSGTMISIFPALQRQLRITVEALRPPQQFGIIFFAEKTTQLSATLQLANTETKRKAFEFVDAMTANGPTIPKQAITQAFALNPQMIFVLTDGFDQGDPNEIAAQFKRLNVGRKVKVNTILIRSTDDPELVKVLRGIAADNGGTYKEVDKQDF